MIVAIHQPNYAPWLGYFRKISRAEAFVFLDDVSFSKGSVTNRVKILDADKEAWLTVPAKPALGTAISDIVINDTDWPARHLSRLRNAYRGAAAFETVWEDLEPLYESLPAENLSLSNRILVEALCGLVGVETRFHLSSEMGIPTDLPADERLIEIIRQVSGTVYLSGSGGRKYQDESKFEAAGISVSYNDYVPTPYPQRRGDGDFVPGLSMLDAAFNLGWEAVGALLRNSENAD